MAGDLDLTNRDPNNLNEHVKCDFQDVIGEPDGSHSIDCVWKMVNTCYLCSQGICYKLPTFLCGWAFAIVWGASFAWLGLCHIWCFTPCTRICMTTCSAFQRCWGTLTSCCCRPIFEAYGACFENIKITKQ